MSPGDEFAVTMLEAAAARPVEEVADLLRHLGSERTSRLTPALQRAAATRPVEDLARLLALLRPQAPASADAILRTAVLSRSADDVALLAALLSTDPASGIQDALREAAAVRPVPDVAHLTQLLHSTPTVSGLSPAPAPAAPYGSSPEDEAASASASAEPETPEELDPGVRPPVGTGPRAFARLRGSRSPLRWSAAAALVASAALHLSIVFPYWGQNPAADAGFSMAAVLCLVLAGLVVLRDSLWLWIAAAVTGVSTVIGYLLSDSLFVLDLRTTMTPWQSGLGFATIACALTLLALTALLATAHRRRPAGPVGSVAPATDRPAI
ncbi:hypothetical protein ACFZDG_22975 [Kitasatospora xanthocidica]|uniref:hypothetical protein n=1 Tax=Kitasatospora xanthocidica TaxID=83382 RepID=UPI0036E9E792